MNWQRIVRRLEAAMGPAAEVSASVPRRLLDVSWKGVGVRVYVEHSSPRFMITARLEGPGNELDVLAGVCDGIDYAEDEAELPARVARLATSVRENPPADEERPRIPQPVVEPVAHVRFRHVVFPGDRRPPFVAEVRGDDMSLPINAYTVQLYRGLLRKEPQRFDQSLFLTRTVFERAGPSLAFVGAFQAGEEVLRSALVRGAGADAAEIAKRLGAPAADWAARADAPPLAVSVVVGSALAGASTYSAIFRVPAVQVALALFVAAFDTEWQAAS